MLKVRSVVSKAAEVAHRTVTMESYMAKALDVIDAKLPFWSTTLPQNAQRRVIEESYLLAKQMGFKTETDHLKFLVAVFFLGSHFASDYQFYDDLTAAGWTEKKLHKPSLPRLCHQIDLYTSAVSEDVISRKRIMLALVSLCRQTPRDMSVALVHEACLDMWPNRTERMRNEVLNLWIKAAGHTAQKLGLSGTDILLHSVLAMYFGHRFHEDPLYPWAIEAYLVLPVNNDPSRDIWRMQLLDGVREYFDNKFRSRPEMQ